jgi:hypothetical protein
MNENSTTTNMPSCIGCLGAVNIRLYRKSPQVLGFPYFKTDRVKSKKMTWALIYAPWKKISEKQ